ncbi:MAG: hypothetical protein ACRD1K_18925, partial [Acidimicrobiales bacterium]
LRNGAAEVVIVLIESGPPIYFDPAPGDPTAAPYISNQYVTPEGTIHDAPQGPCSWRRAIAAQT